MPQASRLEEELKNNFPNAKINLIKDSGGTFIVKVDEKVIFDKLAMSENEKRFPKDDEISDKINNINNNDNEY